MGDDLGICLRGEDMAFAFKNLFKSKIVFNNAIVDDSDLACFMGMSILV